MRVFETVYFKSVLFSWALIVLCAESDDINRYAAKIIDPKVSNDLTAFLQGFREEDQQKHMWPTNINIPSELNHRDMITLAGVGPLEVRELVLGWIEKFKRYRSPFATIDSDQRVFMSMEASDNVYTALNFDPGIDSNNFVNDYADLSYVISAIDMGSESYNNLVQVPIMLSAIVISYNLPEIPNDEELNLNLNQIARIFLGDIRHWGDASFSENNPWHNKTNLAFTKPAITIALPKGRSVLLKWLTNAFFETDRTLANLTSWNIGQFTDELGFEFINKVTYDTPLEVLGGTMSTKYRLCLATVRGAWEYKAKIARIEPYSGAGYYLPPSIEDMKGFAKYRADLTNRNNSVYPFLSFYYLVMKKNSTSKESCTTAKNMLRFVRFLLTDPQIDRDFPDDSLPYVMVDGPFYALLARDLFTSATFTCVFSNDSIWNMVKFEILNEMRLIKIAQMMGTNELIMLILFPILFCMALITWKLIKFFNIMQRIKKGEYKIDSSDIFLALRQNETMDRYKGVIASRRMVDYHIPRSYMHTLYFGKWKAYQVMLRPCSLNIHRMDNRMKQAIIEMIDFSQHSHVGTFYGLSELKNGRYFVSDFCPYGDLRSTIIAKEYTFTLNIKFSLAADIADGMHFLHRRGFLHGNLRSCAIYIEADLSAKVGDWEYAHLHGLQSSYFAQETRLAKTLTLFEQTAFYPWLYWTAPEVLQSGMLGRAAVLSKAQDVYSFGIILGEIFGEDAAFQRFQDAPYNFTPTEILTKILSANLRPRLLPGNDAPVAVHHLLEHCWSFAPNERPSFKTIKSILHQVTSFRKPISDLVVIESQLLADKLKHKGKKMEELYDAVSKEFHKFSHVLVPQPVWRQIYLSHVRPPLTRHEDAVTLRCSLTNFDNILAAHDPQVAVETLNLMHRVFDEMIEKNGRVYRLYWDGATVTAVGGAPFGLDLDPVHSIAQIALDYLVWTCNTRAPSQPALKLRFGLHSGPVAAGCLDYSAAHYVLFGELSKVVYLIELASKPNRILVSDDFNNRLKKLAKVYARYRVIEASQSIRGYEKKTHWLVGSNYFDQQYLLDDILYGNDEMDGQADNFVLYGSEEGLITDCHTSRTESVHGENINGSGLPIIMKSAAIVRALRKRQANNMKVPPQHILDSQVMRVGKNEHQQPHQRSEEINISNQKLGRNTLVEKAAAEQFPPTTTDVTVGIYQRSDFDDERQNELDITIPLFQNTHLENINFGHLKGHGTSTDAKSNQSILSTIHSDLLSTNTGESRLENTARLNILHTPVSGGLLGLNETGRVVRRLENTPLRSIDYKKLSVFPEEILQVIPMLSTPNKISGIPVIGIHDPKDIDLQVCSQITSSILLDRASETGTATDSSQFITKNLLALSSQASTRTLPSNGKFDKTDENRGKNKVSQTVFTKSQDELDVSNNDIHVFADLSDVSSTLLGKLSPLWKRHVQKLTASYTNHLHMSQWDPEELDSNLLDERMQDIRNTEIRNTDSDSFHLHLPGNALQSRTGTSTPETIPKEENITDHGLVRSSRSSVSGFYANPPDHTAQPSVVEIASATSLGPSDLSLRSFWTQKATEN